MPPNVFLDVLHNPSIKVPTKEELAIPDPEAQLVAALHVLPEDETLGRQIIRRSKSMTIINGELHRYIVTGAIQHCVSPQEGCEIL